MSGGNRGIIAAAIFGLASTCFGLGAFVALEGSYQPSSYPKYRERAPDKGDGTNKAVADKAIQPPEEKQPCTEPYGREESDLCAQWQAADAAKKAADWAWWQMIFSGLGVLGIGVTLWFNKRAIDIALGASDDMERSLAIAAQGAQGMQSAATAMRRVAIVGREQLDHARDSANRQLRAYITTEDHAIAGFWRNGPTVFHLKVWNRGQTPAYDVRIWSIVTGTQGDPDRAKIFKVVNDSFRQSAAVIGPGQAIVHDNDCQAPLNGDSYASVVMGGGKFVYAGVVTYRDAFGKRHFTTFKQFYVGNGNWDTRADDLMACGRGNIAS